MDNDKVVSGKQLGNRVDSGKPSFERVTCGREKSLTVPSGNLESAGEFEDVINGLDTVRGLRADLSMLVIGSVRIGDMVVKPGAFPAVIGGVAIGSTDSTVIGLSF